MSPLQTNTKAAEVTRKTAKAAAAAAVVVVMQQQTSKLPPTKLRGLLTFT